MKFYENNYNGTFLCTVCVDDKQLSLIRRPIKILIKIVPKLSEELQEA